MTHDQKISNLIFEINKATKFIHSCKYEEQNPMMNHVTVKREGLLKELAELKRKPFKTG